MNTRDISKVLKNDHKASTVFQGVYSRDGFINALRTAPLPLKGTFIFNTHRTLLPGEHWICVICHGEYAEYFDSFGRHPGIYKTISELLRQRFKTVLWNSELLQNTSTTLCGDYCILFALLSARQWSMERYIEWLSMLGSSHQRDHLLRQLTISIYGKKSFSSYRTYRSALEGRDAIHLSQVLTAQGARCDFD